MPKSRITPPAPPDLKGAREVEKQQQAAQVQTSDEEGGEESSVEEIRGHLHDAVESLANALQGLDELEGG
jgi:hypothetical protein